MIKKNNIQILNLIVLLGCTLFMHSCYTLKDTALLQESAALPKYPEKLPEDYKIQPNDEVIFSIASQDEEFVSLFSNSNSAGAGSNQMNSYRVYPDGTVDIPFVDKVKVSGLTMIEAGSALKSKFREIIPDAEIKVTLANKTYTVIGDAGTGTFPVYKERLTIYQALAQSGQLQLSGDRKHVKIIRDKGAARPEILEFDIRPKSVINSKYYYIYPNDIIYVQRSPLSFYKVNSYGAFLGLITSSLSLLTTVFYLNKIK